MRGGDKYVVEALETGGSSDGNGAEDMKRHGAITKPGGVTLDKLLYYLLYQCAGADPLSNDTIEEALARLGLACRRKTGGD